MGWPSYHGRSKGGFRSGRTERRHDFSVLTRFFHHTARVSGKSGGPKQEAIDYEEDETPLEILCATPGLEWFRGASRWQY